MAISPKLIYPAQIDATSDPTGYPRGKAQNDIVEGDGVGTPYEKTLLNDVLGMQQELLSAAGATPSGTPDKVGASQYVDAIRYICRDEVRMQPLVPTQDATNARVPEDFVFEDVKMAWVQQGSGKVLFFPITNMPAHGNLVSVTLGVGGGLGLGGNWTAIPTGPGTMRVQWIDGAGVVQADSSIPDPATPLAVWNAAHLFQKVLDTPLPLNLTGSADQIQAWVRVTSPSDGSFETNKWGIHKLYALFTE